MLSILNDNRIVDEAIIPFNEELLLRKYTFPITIKSVITCIFPYYLPLVKGNLSMYTVSNDYHTIIKSILLKVCEKLAKEYNKTFLPYVDSSPINEVLCGAIGGLGVIGRNNLLLTPKYGSFVFIGTIITDEVFPYTVSSIKYCINCKRCGKCEAITDNFARIDCKKCVSFITQKKGELRADEIALIKEYGYVWGCDRCQLVCPYNSSIPSTNLLEFTTNLEYNLTYDNYEKLAITKSFGYKGTKILLRNLDILNSN